MWLSTSSHRGPYLVGLFAVSTTAQRDHWERNDFNRLTPEASQSKARAEFAPNTRLAVSQLCRASEQVDSLYFCQRRL